MVLELLDINIENSNLDIDWIIDLNVHHKIIKQLENNIGGNLDNLGYSSNFLDTTPEV